VAAAAAAAVRGPSRSPPRRRRRRRPRSRPHSGHRTVRARRPSGELKWHEGHGFTREQHALHVRTIAPRTEDFLARGRLGGRGLEEEHVISLRPTGEKDEQLTTPSGDGVGHSVLRKQAGVGLGKALAVLRQL
jgi:hypothetical protein